ncbi:MAG: nucleotidyltransferase domain-containing protein [Draconibacterium sp.]|nr:nucleotidyltransferase domain-containing protein [Draconibacterium sp.]
MLKQEIQNIIVAYLKKFNPEFVGLFGSFAREDNTNESDIDILIKFQKSLSLLQLIRIENQLSEKLGIKVDLVTEGSLKNKRVKRSIQNDLKIIYRV